VSFELDAS